MKLVMIESPFKEEMIEAPYEKIKCREEESKAYLKACILDSLGRNEAPFASHGFYTQYLDDTKLEEREIGINAGFAWGEKADIRAFYVDYGVSSGMKEGLQKAWHIQQIIDIRTLPYKIMKDLRESFKEEKE